MDIATQISGQTEEKQSMKKITVIGETGIIKQCHDVRKSGKTSSTHHEVKAKTIPYLSLPLSIKAMRKFLGIIKLWH